MVTVPPLRFAFFKGTLLEEASQQMKTPTLKVGSKVCVCVIEGGVHIHKYMVKNFNLNLARSFPPILLSKLSAVEAGDPAN